MKRHLTDITADYTFMAAGCLGVILLVLLVAVLAIALWEQMR
jgi:hypothetical protein